MNLCEREIAPGQVCNQTASDTIRIRDSGTKKMHRVHVCREHKAEHDRAAAERRANAKIIKQ